MFFSKVSRGRNVSVIAVTVILFSSLVVSCVAGIGTEVTTDGPAPVESAPQPVLKEEGKYGTVDVTGYYSRKNTRSSISSVKGLTVFETENFIGSGNCAFCHTELLDSAGNDMSISGHWQSTMMANAAKDPLWLAKVSSEVKRNPALKEVIEEKCATCHMPMAWTQAYKQGDERLVLGNGLLNPGHDLNKAAMDGVSCSLCHQVRDENLGQKESFSGKFIIDTGKKAPEREIFGPYKDPVEKIMRQSVGFTPKYGPQTNDSALCATCHTLYTPFVDAQGNVAGEFPEQTPFLEWKYSDFGVNSNRRYDIGENPGQGKICQECHMPHSDAGPVRIAEWTPKGTGFKDHFSQHHFVGGNVFMLNIMQDNISSLQLTAPSDRIEDTRERTMLQLQSETAGLELTELMSRGNEITAELQVNNKVGHKFPSGIPTRRSWIHFLVEDASGQMVFESGKPLADGRIAGNDADDDIMSYEPHYDVITQPGQVQIYEGVMLNTDNAVTYTLLRAAKYAKDNRLLPIGFDKNAVPQDIAVFGAALTDEDFTGGSDQVTYRIDTSGYRGPYTITARLLFTAVSYPFVKDLAKDEDLPEVRRFMAMYRRADKMGQEIIGIRATVR
ncbi:hypothetical protein ACFLYW_03260 [Thermodesulfobacteriota bacterium]